MFFLHPNLLVNKVCVGKNIKTIAHLSVQRMPLDSNVVEYLAQPVPGSELEDPKNFMIFRQRKKWTKTNKGGKPVSY